MAKILNGGPVAKAIRDRLKERIAILRDKGIIPCLAIIRAGHKGDDLAYEQAVKNSFSAMGLRAESFELDENDEASKLRELINRINIDENIHGCIIMRPLPPQLEDAGVFDLLSPCKDLDCVGRSSLGGMFSCCGDCFCPCTAQACMEMMRHYDIDLEGANAAVIGRSLVVGRPLSVMLEAENATVTMCHTKTKGLADICRRQDIIVSAAGCPGLVDESFLDSHQVVIDVGINPDERGNICGDVDFEQAKNKVTALSPVPGGVGSVTTAVLAEHLVKAAERRFK